MTVLTPNPRHDVTHYGTHRYLFNRVFLEDVVVAVSGGRSETTEWVVMYCLFSLTQRIIVETRSPLVSYVKT